MVSAREQPMYIGFHPIFIKVLPSAAVLPPTT
jgi:hypothetical protein